MHKSIYLAITFPAPNGKMATHEVRLGLDDYHKLSQRARRKKMSASELLREIITNHNQPDGYQCKIDHGLEVKNYLSGKKSAVKKKKNKTL